MRKHLTLWVVPLFIGLVAIGGYWVWTERPPVVAAGGPVAVTPLAVAPLAPQPAIKFPLEGQAAADRQALPAADKIDAFVSAALIELLGRKAVLSMLQTGDFARRVVVTVDNLAREHAAPRNWPVNPAPGRFAVTGRPGAQSINPDNGLRYLPFILMVESVDLAHAVALYARLYPLLQRAYEDLGYPDRYFNDRLVEVIDNLLAAAQPPGPVRVRITEVKGPIQATRPWLSYEFADPALQSLSSGQKLLVRMGPDNERRLKARLVEIRRLVTHKGASR